MRLFVAIELNKSIGAGLARVQSQLGKRTDAVRWVRSDQLHMTARFVGEIPDGRANEIADAVAAAAKLSSPFSMQIEGCGCFPPRGEVRIIWADVREDSGALVSCVKAINEALEPIGYPPEDRPFSPHLTLGRVRSDRSNGKLRSLVGATTFKPMAQSVTSVTLMSSVLSPQGPSYAAVSRPALDAAGKPSMENA